MALFRRIARQNVTHFAVALVVASSWISGCGSDDDDDGDDGSGGTSGSGGSVTGGTAGVGGTPTGGTAGVGGTPTGGTGGMPTGGTGGMPTGGSGGMPTGGTAGSGMGGDDGMGGDGAGGDDGMGGDGAGGEGGSIDAMCTTGNLGIALVSAAPMQAHDHLPIDGTARMTLLGMINTGAPLTFTLPTDGSNPHNHTLTFTAQQLTTLRNGGTLAMNVVSAMDGPTGNLHTHTYSLECAP